MRRGAASIVRHKRVMSGRSRRLYWPVLGRGGRWVMGIVLLLLLGVGGWWAVTNKVLSVKRVVIEYQVAVQPMVMPKAEIARTVAAAKGRWLWQRTDDLKARLYKQYAPISTVEMRTTWPGTLTVSLLPRVPLCQIVTPEGVYLVDRGGFIFARIDKEQEYLLTMRTSTMVEVGKKISSNSVALGLQAIKELRSVKPALQQLDLHDGQLDIHLQGPPLIFIGQDKPADEVLPQLVALLDTFSREDKFPQEVDMRYDRPVLRY